MSCSLQLPIWRGFSFVKTTWLQIGPFSRSVQLAFFPLVSSAKRLLSLLNLLLKTCLVENDEHVLVITAGAVKEAGEQSSTSMLGRSLPPSPYPHAVTERGWARAGPPPPTAHPPPPPPPVSASHFPPIPPTHNHPDRKRWSLAVGGSDHFRSVHFLKVLSAKDFKFFYYTVTDITF